MKKFLFTLFALMFIAQFGICADTTTATSIFSDLKNAIVSDVTNTVTTNVNSVKLAAYKTQLEQKQQELEEVEASSSNVIIKYFKKARINSKISELEANIAELEAAE